MQISHLTLRFIFITAVYIDIAECLLAVKFVLCYDVDVRSALSMFIHLHVHPDTGQSP